MTHQHIRHQIKIWLDTFPITYKSHFGIEPMVSGKPTVITTQSLLLFPMYQSHASTHHFNGHFCLNLGRGPWFSFLIPFIRPTQTTDITRVIYFEAVTPYNTEVICLIRQVSWFVQKTVKEQRIGKQVRASRPQWNSQSIPAKHQQHQSTSRHCMSTQLSSIHLDDATFRTDNAPQLSACQHN